MSLTSDHADSSKSFLSKGYALLNVEDRQALDQIRDHVVDVTCRFLKTPPPQDPQRFLDEIHLAVPIEQLNDLRLEVIQSLQDQPWFREAYFSCARSCIEDIVGNELAMQKNLGLSIQLPNDKSSLLPLHSDVWGSECSGFEAVVWLPLVDCFGTKSIFFLPPHHDIEWRKKAAEYSDGSEGLFRDIESKVDWLTVDYGQVLVFTPTLMHGNRVNRETTTRWSINIRFKGLFTPYAGKRMGEYFQPLRIRPLTEVAMRFALPGGFNE